MSTINIHEEFGTIFVDGYGLERPAIIVDAESDTLIAYGDYMDVKIKFDKYTRPNVPDILKHGITMLTFDTLSNQEIIYILNRAVNYTASGFIKNLTKKHCDPDVRTWLDTEMQRVPVTDV